MASGLLDPNTLHDDVNINYRIPGNAINSAQDDYIKRIVDEMVLRSCVLGLDLRTVIRDYETKSHTIGYLHMSHLYETLRKLGVRISPEDFSVLLKKYQVYGMFVQVEPLVSDIETSLGRLQANQRSYFHPLMVTDEITRSHMKVPFERLKRHDYKAIHPKEFFKSQDTSHPTVDRWPKREHILSTIIRIQTYCLTNGRRPEEFFKEHDKTRCGRITKAQFLRGVDSLATCTGTHSKLQISPEEAEEIAEIYTSTTSPGMIHWQKFIDDLSEVYGPLDIKRNPNAPVDKSGPTELPGKFAGYTRFSKQELIQMEEAIAYVKAKLIQTKAHLRPFFKSYDKFNHGFVSPVQFRQVLSTVNIPLSHEQGWIMVKYYTEKEGFNYHKFLLEVEHEEGNDTLEQEVPKKDQASKQTDEEVQKKSAQECFDPGTETEVDSIEGVLAKVKHAVYERHLRPAYFFEQYDELKQHFVDRDTFMRAMISTFHFPLTLREYKILMDAFADPLNPELILYRSFLRVVCEVDWQEGLEKAPLVVPLPYVANESFRRRPYSRDETHALEMIWKKLVGKITINDWDVFEDSRVAANVKGTTLTKLGLEKTLAKLRVLHRLTQREVALLFDAFSVLRGREVRFDWVAFVKSADMINRNLKTF